MKTEQPKEEKMNSNRLLTSFYTIAGRPSPYTTLGAQTNETDYHAAVKQLTETLFTVPPAERTPEIRTVAMLAIAIIEGREEPEFKTRMLYWLMDKMEIDK